MVDAYGNDIVATHVEVGSEVIHERHVSVGAMSQVVTVEVYIAAVIHALEVDVVAGGIVAHSKGLAIPSYASGQVTCAAGQLLRGSALHTPVVGQLHGAPAAVVVVGLAGCTVIVEDKAPPSVELVGLAERYLSRGTEAYEADEEGK